MIFVMNVLDRRPVLADLWTSVPAYELVMNGVPRTVFASNKMEDLKIFLGFSIPIINTTEQVLNALIVNSGNLVPIHRRNQGYRQFSFQVSRKLHFWYNSNVAVGRLLGKFMYWMPLLICYLLNYLSLNICLCVFVCLCKAFHIYV